MGIVLLAVREPLMLVAVPASYMRIHCQPLLHTTLFEISAWYNIGKSHFDEREG